MSPEDAAPTLRGKVRHKSLLLFFISMTRARLLTRWLFVLLLFPIACFGQAWSGVIAPSRGMDWSKAGADPAVVNEARTQCGATISPIGTSASPAAPTAINTAIASCASSHPLPGVGGYVQLAAGSFYLNNQLTYNSNVTLRGMGAGQTFIYFSGSASTCPFSGGADMCIVAPSTGLGYDGSTDNIASWTSGYSQGTTSITINSFSKGSGNNWKVGSLIFLDQLDTLNSPIPTSGLAVCRNGACGGGNVSGRPGRSLTEPQIITSISGSGPWTVGITPGIRMSNWFTSGNTPQVWGNSGVPISKVGVENMSIDISNALSRFSTVLCMDCYNVWIKGVRFSDTFGDTETGANGFYQFYPVQSMRVTMQDSYTYGSPPVSNYYVMSCWTSGDELYQNNISQHIAFSFMAEGCIGSVAAYNFAIDDYYTHCHGCSLDAQWQQASSYRHGGTDALLLFEGNEGIGTIGDLVFGASDLITVFRNAYNGRDPNGGSSGGKTEQTNAVLLYPGNRFWNIIGNVMGTAGYHTTYQCSYPTPTSCNNDLQIYSLGYANGYSAANDPYVAGSMMRWGNYDTVSNAVRFVNAEVPIGLLDGFANVLPSSQNLPASFYLSSKPSWWGVQPWPATGPDVTGGNVVFGSGAASTLGGHAYHIPAAACYLSVMKGPTNGSASLMSFDASTCYGSSSAQAPAPPTNLNAVAQ